MAGHALDALETSEARELSDHLSACVKCRAESISWQNTAASLAFTSEVARPSPEVRSRILASIKAEGEHQAARSTEKGNERVANSPDKTSRADSKVVPFEKPARRGSRVAWAIALAASVAFIALALSLILVWNRYNAMRHEMAQLGDRLDQANGELARERESLTRERQARELITSPEASLATLAGTEMARSARARLAFDRNSGRAMLMAYDLPPAPSGKAYQLWYIAEGKPPMPGQVFNTDSAGHAEMSGQLSEQARAATSFAVTLEPAAGVSAPSGPMYLTGAIS